MTSRRSSKRDPSAGGSTTGPPQTPKVRKWKPVEVAHHNGMRILNDLWRVERTVRYLVSERDNFAKHGKSAALKPDASVASKPDVPAPVLSELNDALVKLSIFARHDEWFERSADTCLRSGIALHVEAARLVLRLKRIGAQTVAIYREGNEHAFHHFVVGLIPPSRSKNTRKALRFLDACWTSATRILGNLTTYLSSIDLPALSADMDSIRLRLAGPFVPSPRQRMLHETLKENPDGLTKKQLAKALGEEHPENLYRRWGLTELQSLGFIENRPPTGYVVTQDLPPASNAKRRG